jgi:hypothetical protein
MMKALHKLSTMKRETFIFTKVKHPFIHKHGYHTKYYINGYKPFVQVIKMEPAYQKQNGHVNHLLMPQVTSEVTRYHDTC